MAPKTANKLVPLLPDEYDAIKIGGGPGRQAKPSQRLTEVQEALNLMPAEGWGSDTDGWFVIKATEANKNEVNARELRKAGKQLTQQRDDNQRVHVEIRPRENHPKHGNFVAFRVSLKPVESEDSSGDSQSQDK